MTYQHSLTGTSSELFSSQSNRQIDYYVDGALGDDSNLGTMDSPFKTIQAAIDAADESNNAGHNNIYINSGRYVESLQINDDDLLTLNGLGDDPWDVTIGTNSPLQQMGAINITGGSAVELSNLQASGGYNGIYAANVATLMIDTLFVNDNTLNGLYLENVANVGIQFSRFFNNGNNGIYGTSIDSFHSINCYVFDNDFHGVELSGIGDAVFDHNNVFRNGDHQLGLTWVGISVSNVNFLHVNGGNYFDNFNMGISGNTINTAVFDDVNVFGISSAGVSVVSVESVTVNGGDYVGQVVGFRAIGTGSDQSQVVFNNVKFSNNVAGIGCGDFGTVQFNNLDVSSSVSTGVIVRHSKQVVVNGGIYHGNGGSGLLIDECEYVMVNNVVSRDNMENGLHFREGNKHITINGGMFYDNAQAGIRAHGASSSYNHELFVNDVVVFGNFEGIKVEYYDNVTINGGYYSQNTAHGLHFFDFNNAELNNVYSIGNGGSGAHFNLGQFFADDEMGNYNNVTINGGYYNKNGHHGIIATTEFDRSDKLLHFNFTAAGVSASQNYRSGLYFINTDIDSPVTYLSPLVTPNRYGRSTIDIKGGQFNNNGNHGAYMFGSAYSKYFVQVDAAIDSVTASGNGHAGLTIGSGFIAAPWYAAEQPRNDTWISVTNSNFNSNRHDGLRIRFAGRIGQHEYQQIALIENINALNNQYSGLDIESALLDETLPDAVISINKSYFNRNGRYGISASRAIDFVNEIPRYNTPNYVLTNILASQNESSGVSIFGPDVDATWLSAPSVTFNGGRVDQNATFGISVYNLASLVVNGTYVTNNGYIGIGGRYIQMADVASAIATGNQEQDIDISEGAG